MGSVGGGQTGAEVGEWRYWGRYVRPFMEKTDRRQQCEGTRTESEGTNKKKTAKV